MFDKTMFFKKRPLFYDGGNSRKVKKKISL